MADWTNHAREALLQGPAALVTILATEGSAPRGPGARMVVTKSGLKGTIGGGALEHQSAAQARAILALEPGSWRVQDYPLGPLLGQCCGGRVRLLVEHLESVPDGEGPFEVTLSDRVERKLLPGPAPSFPGEGRGPAPLFPGEGRGPAPSFPGESRGPAPLFPGESRGPAPLFPGESRGPATDSDLGPGLGSHQSTTLMGSFRRGTIGARGPLPAAGTHFIEPAETDLLPVTMFGAGHVGRAVAARAAGLPLHFAWHDSRPEAAETAGVVLADEDAMVACAGSAGGDAAVLILTHDHALDYRLTAAALGGRARFVGLIGSKTKRARFLSRLEKDGVDSERLTCPIGIAGIVGKEPEVIAIATLAQLLMLRSPA